ncbi:hypothetical protein MRX96_007671 [Rhipicephalus microplus]
MVHFEPGPTRWNDKCFRPVVRTIAPPWLPGYPPVPGLLPKRARHDSVDGLECLFTRNPEDAVSVGRSLLRLATPGYYK